MNRSRPNAAQLAGQASGVFVRSFGWVAFGLIMAASFAALANVPRGISSLDESHPLALSVAACMWAVCWIAARVARGRGARARLFRPVTVRAVALISVVAISTLANWYAEQQNARLIKERDKVLVAEATQREGQEAALAAAVRPIVRFRGWRPTDTWGVTPTVCTGPLAVGCWVSATTPAATAHAIVERLRATTAAKAVRQDAMPLSDGRTRLFVNVTLAQTKVRFVVQSPQRGSQTAPASEIWVFVFPPSA